ncbi:hypothetical protein SD51_06725 [Alicyclobacillus tengchongensis]|nr:hypothetical protein SD51_06725 [Alicyclobacillus tengchongensis]
MTHSETRPVAADDATRPSTLPVAAKTNQALHADHDAVLRHDLDIDPINPEKFLREILKSHRELEIARRQFEYVSAPLLIDHIVFRIGAAERQLNYLFRLAREHGISFDGQQWDWTSDEWRID